MGYSLAVTFSPLLVQAVFRKPIAPEGLHQSFAQSSEDHNLRAKLKRVFLVEEDWNALLSDAQIAEVAELIQEQTSGFWKTSPIAESASYRLFGFMARSDPNAASRTAVNAFLGDHSPKDSTKTCLPWAFLGILENRKRVAFRNCLIGKPDYLLPTITESAILGSDDGTIDDDVRSFKALLSETLGVEKQTQNKPKLDSLLRNVVEAWIRRDPLAVTRWLQTKNGEPYTDMLSSAISNAACGDPSVLSKLAQDSQFPSISKYLGSACYECGFEVKDIRALLSTLPEASRSEFLKAYADHVSQGSPKVLIQFVGDADISLLTPEVAGALAHGVMKYDPELFSKLTSNLAPESRITLLDRTIGTTPVPTVESADYYLKTRGMASPWAEVLIRSAIARVDLSKALNYIRSAPEEKRTALVSESYCTSINTLINTQQPTQAILAAMKTVPAEVSEEVSERVIRNLTLTAPLKAKQLLELDAATNPTLWGVFFENASLSPQELNQLMADKLQKPADSSVYASVASSLVDRYANQDIESARGAVENVADPAVREQCTGELVRVWSKADPIGAMEYVKQFPAGSRRDAAIAALLPNLAFAPDKQKELLSTLTSAPDAAAPTKQKH